MATPDGKKPKEEEEEECQFTDYITFSFVIMEKQTHYTIVMGDFNTKVRGQTNTSERATG